MARVSLLSLILALTTNIAASTLTLSLETPLTPGTQMRATEGAGGMIATNGRDFVAVWIAPGPTLMAAPVDSNGQRFGPVTAVIDPVYSATIVAMNDSFIVIGVSINAVYARVIPAGGAPPGPLRKIHDGYVNSVNAASNGSVMLLTMMTVKLNTETLTGSLFDASLNRVRDAFPIAWRELPSQNPGHAVLPRIASNGRDFLIAWEETNPDDRVSLVPISSSGDVGPAATTDVGTPALQPAVAADGTGYIVAWHDGSSIHAMRVHTDGTADGMPVLIARANAAISNLAIGENVIAWIERAVTACDWRGIGTAHAQPFDASLQPAGRSRLIDDAVSPFDLSITGSVAVWEHETCSGTMAVMAAPLASTSTAHLISSYLALSQQQSPAVASDGASAVAVWIEQRAADDTAQIYAARADGDDPGIAISEGDADRHRPRIAFDGERYLATWSEIRDSAAVIVGRFLARDASPAGAPFVIGTGDAADVAWNGFEYVVAWPDRRVVTAARVSTSGDVTAAGSTEDFRTTSHVYIAGGPGEAVLEFAATTRDEWLVVAAVVPRNGPIEATTTLASASQTCIGMPKACQYGAEPIGIAWNGSTYVAESLVQNHPAYGYAIGATTLAIGGVPTTATRRVRSGGIGVESTASAGPLVWMGDEFLSAITANWRGSVYVQRLTFEGAALDGYGTAVAAQVDGEPAAARTGAHRLLLVYAKSSRLFMRTVEIAPSPKQRAARRLLAPHRCVMRIRSAIVVMLR